MRKFISQNKIILLIILLFIFLRFPSFFEGFWYPDEGFYAAQAEAILRGKELYLEAWDHKPPLMSWLYLIGGVFGWNIGYPIMKLLSIISGIITILIFRNFLIIEKINAKIQIIIFVILAILLGSPLLEGNLANTEIFFIPITLTILCLSLYRKKAFIIGFLLSLALLIKPQAFIECIAIISLVAIFDLWKLRRKFDYRYYLELIIPFILLIGIYFSYLLFAGSFGEFIDATLITNYQYIGQEPGASTWNLFKILGSAFIFCYALIKLDKGQISRTNFVIFLTLVVDITLVTLSGRPYVHYLIQLLPISLLSLVFYLRIKPTTKLKLTELILGFLILVIFLLSKGFNFPVIEKERLDGHLSYYSDFPQYFFMNKTDGHSWFWKNHNYFIPKNELIEYFKDSYSGLDYYYYGNDPWIFTQLDGNFVNKYLVWYHLIYSESKMSEAKSLRDSALILIVDQDSDLFLEPFFEDLDSKFTLSDEIYNYKIYINNEYQ